jgi:hypothetical protein
MKLSECRKFVLLDPLYIDRDVFITLANWASERGLGVQAAVQVAILTFNAAQRTSVDEITTDSGRTTGARPLSAAAIESVV